MSAIFVSAMKEWRRSTARGGLERPQPGSLQQRIERVMDITLGREMQRLERQMIFLASVGSSAPFIGLFGTVWGIMNAFTSIAATKNTTLVVVAPGIAEALFATALGLVAAIPAVIGFNKLSTDLGPLQRDGWTPSPASSRPSSRASSRSRARHVLGLHLAPQRRPAGAAPIGR